MLWLPFSLAAQAKHAAQVSAAGETLNELARDIRQVESLLAEDSASEQPNFGPRNGMPMPPVQQSEAMRPIQQGAKMDEDLSFYYASLPLIPNLAGLFNSSPFFCLGFLCNRKQLPMWSYLSGRWMPAWIWNPTMACGSHPGGGPRRPRMTRIMTPTTC